MKMMATIMSMFGTDDSPDFWISHLKIDEETLQELEHAYLNVIENESFLAEDPFLKPNEATWGWTDASMYLGTFVIEDGPQLEEEWSTIGFDDHMKNIHIFYKELLMNGTAIFHLCQRIRNSQILLLGDNMASLLALNKGHSRNEWSNDLIRRIYEALRESNNHLFTSWVSTKLMRADKLTRFGATPGPRHPITIAPNLPRQGIRAA